jgi:hypothetical protein
MSHFGQKSPGYESPVPPTPGVPSLPPDVRERVATAYLTVYGNASRRAERSYARYPKLRAKALEKASEDALDSAKQRAPDATEAQIQDAVNARQPGTLPAPKPAGSPEKKLRASVLGRYEGPAPSVAQWRYPACHPVDRARRGPAAGADSTMRGCGQDGGAQSPHRSRVTQGREPRQASCPDLSRGGQGMRYSTNLGCGRERPCGRPPRRSVRAESPHTAPTSGAWRRSARSGMGAGP